MSMMTRSFSGPDLQVLQGINSRILEKKLSKAEALKSQRRGYFPECEPYDTGSLLVDKKADHRLYYEQSGNPLGPPVVFLHGGPGAGSSARSRRNFDPEFYRIVVFDQRGAGKSTPNASLINNTTHHLVEDIERLRNHLEVQKWHIVFGGSWGSTLSLAYAEKYPERVGSLVLRGIFLFDQSSIKWLFQGGASEMYPDAWDRYIAPIPAGERGDLLGAYYRRLTSDNMVVRNQAARTFVEWELTISKLFSDESLISSLLKDEKFYAPFARFECHYFVHGGWFETEHELLDNVHKIAHIPCAIIHGRQDIVCRPRAAYELHKKMKNSTLEFIFDAGHSDSEPGIVDALVRATDRMKYLVPATIGKGRVHLPDDQYYPPSPTVRSLSGSPRMMSSSEESGPVRTLSKSSRVPPVTEQKLDETAQEPPAAVAVAAAAAAPPTSTTKATGKEKASKPKKKTPNKATETKSHKPKPTTAIEILRVATPNPSRPAPPPQAPRPQLPAAASVPVDEWQVQGRKKKKTGAAGRRNGKQK